jgi:propanol-preferring alcohol dehydrogenase
MENRMKALVLNRLAPIEDGPLEYREFDDPIVEPNQVLLEVSACGVCHSNLHLVEGDLKVYGIPAMLPIVPGHEVVGAVVGIGHNVKDIRMGQRSGYQSSGRPAAGANTVWAVTKTSARREWSREST